MLFLIEIWEQPIWSDFYLSSTFFLLGAFFFRLSTQVSSVKYNKKFFINKTRKKKARKGSLWNSFDDIDLKFPFARATDLVSGLRYKNIAKKKQFTVTSEWMNWRKKKKIIKPRYLCTYDDYFFLLLSSYFTFYNFMSYRIKLIFSLLFAFSSSQHKFHTFSFTFNFPCLDYFFWLCSFFSLLFMHRTLKALFYFFLFLFSTEIFFFFHVATEAQYPFDVHP